MATAVKQRRGNTSEHGSFTGLEAEITVNTETKTIHVHDGSTAGGIPLAKASDVSSVATQITTADESSDAECFPVFTTDATGNLAPKTDTAFKYNANTGAVTATTFIGALTGNVTGDTSGSSGSCTGNAASADIATGALVNYGSSVDVPHDIVKNLAGKTVIYTAGSGNLVIGVPEIADMSAGKQIHFVNASGGEIQFDLNESGNSSITIDICTGAAVVNTGSDNPKIVAGGVATLISLTTNKLVMFGSGVLDT